MVEVWNNVFSNTVVNNSGEFSCDNIFFEKIKYKDENNEMKHFSEDFEKGIIDERILYQIVLSQDLFMTTSDRSSSQILDFIGDLGGFYQAVDLLVFGLG